MKKALPHKMWQGFYSCFFVNLITTDLLWFCDNISIKDDCSLCQGSSIH
jgi:hypothetical protein